MPQLQVQDGGDVPVLLVELPGVPHDGRLASVRVDGVAVDPPETELEERIGSHLGGAVAGDVHVEADAPRLARCRSRE